METADKPALKRLQSLDALRGFDMFWIMGGEGIFVTLAALTGWPVLHGGPGNSIMFRGMDSMPTT